MRSNQLVLKRLLVSYREWGEGKDAATTVVFLHGWMSEGKIWEKAAETLLSLDGSFRIFALDLPAFGRSQTPASAWSVGDYADLVSDFVSRLGLRTVIIAGHSFGGRVGIKLASRCPAWLQKLVLVNSAGLRIKNFKTKFFAFGAKILKPLFGIWLLRSWRRGVYRLFGASDYAEATRVRETFLKVIDEDLAEDMVKIKVPVLLVWGGKDRDVPLKYGRLMHGLMPHSDLVIFPRAGHFSFLDETQEFTRVFFEFAKKA